MRILRDLGILALIFGAIWLLFTYIPIIPDKDYFSVPISSEEKLGVSILKYQIENNPQISFVENDGIDSVIEIITDRLVSHLEEPLFNYEFYVINSEAANAFTIPGGKIFIYSGLLQLADSAEEIAAVLAHEIGHAQERHVLNKLAKQIGLNVLFSDDSFVLGEITKVLGSTKFDRAQERKADEFAFELLEDAELNPRHFGSIMLKLKLEEPIDSELFEIINSHPDTNKRIRRALNYHVSGDFKESALNINWEDFKLSLSEVTNLTSDLDAEN